MLTLYILPFTNTDGHRRNLYNRTIIQYTLLFTVTIYRDFRRVRRLAKSEYQLLHVSVRLSVRMEQLGSYWTDFLEILYLSIFRKFI